MGDLIGYARVSTVDQSLDLQLDALREAGCARIFHDVATGATAARPELARALDHLRPGDTLVVWRLDRLGRSLRHLIELAGEFEERDVALRSLRDAIDTGTPAGRLTFHLFGALAEFERELLRERTRAGLAAAAARGRRGGRPPVMTQAKLDVARELLNADPRPTLQSVADTIGVGRSTLARHLRLAS